MRSRAEIENTTKGLCEMGRPLGRKDSVKRKRRRTTNVELQDADLIPRRGRPMEVSSDVLATGRATMSQLARLFETDAKTLPKRLKGVTSVGRKGNYKLYNIREAASMIITPGYEVEEWLKQASSQELPPLLLKEFWNGQNARAKFERDMGNLWETARVVEAFADVFATIRMTLLLYVDEVDREEALSDTQREIIRRLTDGLIVRIGEEIEEKFKDYDGDGTDRGADDEFNISAADDDEDELLEAETDEEEDIGI